MGIILKHCYSSDKLIHMIPVIVPWTWVPFFSSMVTVSWLNFIKNLQDGSRTRVIHINRQNHKPPRFHRSRSIACLILLSMSQWSTILDSNNQLSTSASWVALKQKNTKIRRTCRFAGLSLKTWHENGQNCGSRDSKWTSASSMKLPHSLNPDIFNSEDVWDADEVRNLYQLLLHLRYGYTKYKLDLRHMW